MAVGYTTLYLSNGQQVQCYILTAQAVGSEVRCSITGAATATSPFKFSVLSTCKIIDIIESGNATGEMEIVANGQRIGKKIRQSAAWTYLIQRSFIPGYTFTPGVTYGFYQTVLHS